MADGVGVGVEDVGKSGSFGVVELEVGDCSVVVQVGV